MAVCAPPVKLVTYKTRLLAEADSLLASGNFDEAKTRYEKILSSAGVSEDTKSAQFSLAFLNVYYNNPNADWNAALKEFKTFVSRYPNDPRIGDALSWVRILTVIKSFDTEFHRASNQVERLKLDKSEAKANQRIFLDSMAAMMHNCYEIRDSMAKKNSDLENVILDLEKKCQQAGR